MKRQSSPRKDPHVSQRNLKVKIVQRAREGIFDRNPLLATPHTVECRTCGCQQKITYLNYLRSGKFKLEKTETVEVAYAAPTLEGLNYTAESVTPLLIQMKCKKCGAKISCCPASFEYLMFTARKVGSEQIYI